MRVLVAGATGVIGRQLVPLLTELDHQVIAVSRRSQPTPDPKVEAVSVDALDRQRLAQVVRDAKPDAVVHLLTAIPDAINPRKLASEFEVTNRLRTEATETLIGAAQAVGCDRIVTQSIAFAYDLDGARPGHAAPANEAVAMFRSAASQWRTSQAAIENLESQTVAAGGLVLRFGHLYGPGTSYAIDGSTVAQVRDHKFPIGGKGTAAFSFIHAYDAATAVVSGLSRAVSGVLNIVDDDPVLLRDWLPELADILGARKPSSVPKFAVRMFGGDWGVTFLTRLRGADNARARMELNWCPRYTSWREGFRTELAGE